MNRALDFELTYPGTPYRRIPSTVVVGPRGEPVITRAYTEIGGIRFYDSRLIVGRRGECVIDEGGVGLSA